tara:strand:- start:45 stop:218 length:174 start_codon:yes stop_codon:yes gene_type:complete
MAKWIITYELDSDKKRDVLDFTKLVDDVMDNEGLPPYEYEMFLKEEIFDKEYPKEAY